MGSSLPANVISAAQYANSLTNIPTPLLEAIIQGEGTINQTNNPFDINQKWAQDVGMSNIVISLWNSVGVIVANTVDNAVFAFAQGINSMPRYQQFRNDLNNPSTTVYQLMLDLQTAGFAGNDSNYANYLASIYSSIQGQDPKTVTIGEISGQTASSSGGTMPSSNGTSPPNGITSNSGGTTPTNTYTFSQAVIHFAESALIFIIGLVLLIIGITALLRLSAGNTIKQIGEAAV